MLSADSAKHYNITALSKNNFLRRGGTTKAKHPTIRCTIFAPTTLISWCFLKQMFLNKCVPGSTAMRNHHTVQLLCRHTKSSFCNHSNPPAQDGPSRIPIALHTKTHPPSTTSSSPTSSPKPSSPTPSSPTSRAPPLGKNTPPDLPHDPHPAPRRPQPQPRPQSSIYHIGSNSGRSTHLKKIMSQGSRSSMVIEK
jgi:hypothetical protein